MGRLSREDESLLALIARRTDSEGYGAALAAAASASAGADDSGTWEPLVDRMLAADATAFETAIRLTQGAAWRLACQQLGDAELAQDVLQEAYLTAFSDLAKLRKKAAFRPWLLRIVLNRCRNARRARERLPGPLPDEVGGARGFEEGLASKLDVSAAVQQLSAVERSAVLLRDYLHLRYDEMAQILDVPLGTVKSRLNQARRQLYKLLGGGAGR